LINSRNYEVFLNKFLLINFYGKNLSSNRKHYYEANIYTFIYMFDIDLLFIILTPKGPLIPIGDKPVLGSVAWSHTIFRFVETFFSNASRNKLRVSTDFMILGAMDQKLWVFEVSMQSLGS
jgi:hypothetical protein